MAKRIKILINKFQLGMAMEKLNKMMEINIQVIEKIISKTYLKLIKINRWHGKGV